MTPKEFQKSNLVVEPKAGKKRLEDALHCLSDEQCERAGATRSGSVVDLLSEIVTRELLALMEVFDRLPSLPMNLLANADGRTPMMRASMLGREELRIFEELISRFDSLSEAEMSAVGATSKWSAKDLLAHLAYWERAAAEEIREFEAGRRPTKKRTRGQMDRINREVVSANRATPRQRLREELILARSEIMAAMKRAPEELEERSPLAQIVYSHCVRHRGHHLEQLRAWVVRLGKTL